MAKQGPRRTILTDLAFTLRTGEQALAIRDLEREVAVLDQRLQAKREELEQARADQMDFIERMTPLIGSEEGYREMERLGGRPDGEENTDS